MPLLQIFCIAGLAFGAVSLLLVALGLSPMAIAGAMSAGAISNWMRISHVLSIWTPLLLSVQQPYCGCSTVQPHPAW